MELSRRVGGTCKRTRRKTNLVVRRLPCGAAGALLAIERRELAHNCAQVALRQDPSLSRNTDRHLKRRGRPEAIGGHRVRGC